MSDTAGTALITNGGARNWSPDATYVTPDHFAENLVPGTTDMGPAIKLALEAGFNKIHTLPNAVYFVLSQVKANITDDIELENNGAIFGSDFDDGVTDWAIEFIIRINAGVSRFRVSVTGNGEINGTLRGYVSGVSSGSGLLIRDSDHVLVSGQYFNAGEDLFGLIGDSGLVLEYCNNILLDGCTFSGWGDHSIYNTGRDAASTVNNLSERIAITNSIFRNCGGIRIARDTRQVIITDNQFDSVRKMVILGGGTNNSFTGSYVNISNNVARKVQRVGLDLRYTHAISGSVISGNQIYDWGLDQDSAAILLRGVSNATVFGNIIKPDRETPTDTSCGTGIYIISAEDDNPPGTPGQPDIYYHAIDNSIYGNIIQITEGGASVANNYAIVDQQGGSNSIMFNTILNNPPFDIFARFDGIDVTTSTPRLWRKSPVGIGFGGIDPKATVDVSEALVVSRGKSPSDTYVTLKRSLGIATLKSYSPVDNADVLRIDASTNEAGDSPTGGALGIQLAVRGVSAQTVNEDGSISFAARNSEPADSIENSMAFSDGTASTNGFGTAGAGLYVNIAGVWKNTTVS